MPFAQAIRVLNQLRRRKVIRNYALIGSVGATAYLEPLLTEDLDIVVLVDTDEEYISTFRRVTELSEGTEGMHLVFGGVPVQMFPSTTRPLYRDALDNARRARVGNLRVNVASPEHLILLGLEAFRPTDRLRILLLLEVADQREVGRLLRRFDDEEGTLAARLRSIRSARNG